MIELPFVRFCKLQRPVPPPSGDSPCRGSKKISSPLPLPATEPFLPVFAKSILNEIKIVQPPVPREVRGE
jgi:hypothetical protein